MLARLQQIITLSLVAASLTWAAYFGRTGRPVLACAGALGILLAYAAFLASEFLMLAFVQGDDPAPRASPRQLIHAWWHEVLTAPRVFCWHQPFRSKAESDHLTGSAAGRRGVVLVHGFVCNRAFWNPWMTKLRTADVPFVAVNLEPVFGSIDDYIAIVDQAVAKLQAATGLAPVVVAHSMGGLAVRAWLSSIADDTRIHRVLTIGTPHHGTWLARFGLTANGRQMRLNSPWLRSLQQQEPPERLARFICFYSHCDNIVFPPSTATLKHSVVRHIPGTAHVHLAYQGAAYSELLRWVLPQAPEETADEPPHSTEAITTPARAAC